MNSPALLIEDTREGWHDKPRPYKDSVMAWMRSEGLVPEDIRRIEVFLMDVPYAKVTRFVNDEKGRTVVDREREVFVMAEDIVLLS